MSGNYAINVPKLRGRENYDEWAFAAENFLVLEGVFVTEPAPAVTEATAAEDRKAKAKLVMTIDPSLYVHIKDETTVRGLWNKLKALFDDSGFTRKISLLRSLISTRLETSDSMTSYVTQMVETAQKLKGTGFEIDDEWIGSLLLAGLPEKFSPMIMAIEHSGMKISCDLIKTKLLDMSSEFETNTKTDSGAFAAQNRYSRKNSFGTHSFGNGGSGARKKQTKMAEQAQPSEQKTIRCYKCKKIGHYKNQCTEKMNAFSAIFLTNNKFNKSDWYIDSGASVHLVSNKNLLSNLNYEPKTKEIIVANSTSTKVLCTGDLRLATCVKNKQYQIEVSNVLYVPELTTNLLSVSQIIAKGNKVNFNDRGCYIYNAQGICIGEASLENDVYKLKTASSQPLMAAAAQSSIPSITWHRRLGHINACDLSKLRNGAVEGVNFRDKNEVSKSSCIVCCEGKQTRLPFQKSSTKSDDVLAVIHTDLCGPMETKSIGLARYYLLFVDDFSRMCYVYFLKSKDETFKYFLEFKEMVENQKATKIKILRSDNGGEFCSAEFEYYLKKNGIVHQKTNAYTPEQNGLSERNNRSIVEKARCLLFDGQFGKELWAEAVNTAVYLKNRSPATGLDNNITPYEVWTGRKPNLSHLRVYGSPVMVHVPKEKRQKWDKKAQKKYLVGYSENIKGYRLYDPKTRSVTIARDVVFMEGRNEGGATVIVDIPEEKDMQQRNEQESMNKSEELDQTITPNDDQDDPTYNISSQIESSDDSFRSMNTDEEEIQDSEPVSDQQPVKRVRHQTKFYGVSNMCVESVTGEQITLGEALGGPEKEQWLQAMNNEMKSFSENDTWELVDRPSSGTVVKNKWVFQRKYNSENEVRYRARLVAKGFTQVKGLDYNETFSPVVRYSTIRLLFALSVQLDLKINHLDVPTAFLNGYLNECVYMEIPENSNFVNCKNKVLKLKKAVYGLKQSAREWNKRVEVTLLNLGYKKSAYEPCLFTKYNGNFKIFIALFVDDFFVFYNCDNTFNTLKNVLQCEYKIKDLGQLKQCLGMRVKHNNNCISIDQEEFVNKILNRFNMMDCKTSETPMEVNLKLEKGMEACNNNIPYQQLLGSLMYLSVLTRPDISYSVSYLSQYNTCFTETHWKHLKRLLKYLQKTKSYGLVFKKGNCVLRGFVDADWAACTLDRRSYTGYCFSLSGCVVSYESRKQRTVALSSTEAEYMALTEACKEAIYLKGLLSELGVFDNINNITLYSDSQSSIKLATNPMFHKRTKHIDIKHHFVRECVTSNKVNIEYVPTSDMPADLLTKSLCSNKHYKFVKLMGMSEI